MKRKRITPRTAGGSLKASLCSITASQGSNDANAIAANLPQIPGLQIEHVPSFLHVLRVTSKFFQTKPSDQPFTLNDWDCLVNQEGNGRGDSFISDRGAWNLKDGNAMNSIVHRNVHDVLIHRMESISNNSRLTSATALNHEVCQRDFVDVVMAWLDEVNVNARQRKQQQTVPGASDSKPTVSSTKRNQEIHQSSEKNNVSKAIPYSMFLYLWELQQQHKRIRVRRSALFLSGLLLLRSKDCRHHLDQETHLADWISSVDADFLDITLHNNDSNSSQISLKTNSNRKLLQHALLQREAIALISHLVDRGFGKRYPKLSVAAKSLRHRCTSAFIETSDSIISNMMPVGMAKWRCLRDFALLHGHEEVRKVTILLNRADQCLEVLVPRIEGVRHHQPSILACEKGKALCAGKNVRHKINDDVDNIGSVRHGSSNDKINDDADNIESDEDSIDWEDGGEVQSDDAKPADKDQNTHISAVERTMAVLKQTSGPGGKLEIDFDRRIDGDCANIKVDDDTDNNVLNRNNIRKRLKKIVQKLHDKHLVRLSAWLNGLRNADNLCRTTSASFVSMSQEKNNLRLYLIKVISSLKHDISRIISSASRLNIQACKGPDEFIRTPSAQICNKDTSGKTVLPMSERKVVALRGKMMPRQCTKKKTRNQHKFRKITIKFKKNDFSMNRQQR